MRDLFEQVREQKRLALREKGWADFLTDHGRYWKAPEGATLDEAEAFLWLERAIRAEAAQARKEKGEGDA